MNVVALVESEQHVCCRYRVSAFVPYFQDAGITLSIVPWSLGALELAWMLRCLNLYDAVLIQRRLPPLWLLKLLRWNARRLIFDYDDALWLRDSYSGKGLYSRKRIRRFRAMTRRADLMVAGNAYLANHAHPAPSRIIPTSVDPTRYPLAKHEAVEVVRLVWIGSASTLQGLDQFRDVLEAVGVAIPNVRLKLICDRFLEFENLAVETIPWSEATEAEAIADADIGISYVPDDAWSRGKCGLKILQYHAAGLPVVTNPVGVHIDMVRNDETGYVASTTQEWVTAIQRLARDATLRQRLGTAGRTQVEEHYSVAVAAENWIDILRELVRD